MTADPFSHIHASFAQQSLMATFGAAILTVQRGHVEITAPIRENVLQQQGFAHAALTFALGDTAAGYAALTTMVPGDDVLTAEIKINLLAPGRGVSLRAEGRVIKPGRRLVIVAADVFGIAEDGKRTHIAALQGTMVPVTV